MVNTYLYTYKVMLDSLVKPTLTWKNIGMGTAFISNRGNSSGSGSTTGGSTLPVTPGSGGTVPGGTPGATPGTGTPGTSGTGSTATVRPNVSVIIPFAATPMR